MLDTPQIVTTQSQPTAVIRLVVPHAQMRETMGSAIAELMGAVAAQGVGPAGPMYSHHSRMDPAVFDFELGVPVSKPFTPVGRVQPGQLPGARVAQTIYRGPYEGLGDAWCEFSAWIAQEGHEAAENLWERYVAGPESSADPAQWATELNKPLK